jgi:hypothetical protein
VAALRERRLRPGQRRAGGDRELRAHQVHAGDRLGDRVLHLQPRVHFEEVETRGLALPSSRNSTVPAFRYRRRAPPRPPRRPWRADGRRQRGRGALLDDLLVAPLHRALALEEMDDVAVRVGEHLDLDVPRPSISRST